MSLRVCAECHNPLPDRLYRNEVGQRICLPCHTAVMQFLTDMIKETQQEKRKP